MDKRPFLDTDLVGKRELARAAFLEPSKSRLHVGSPKQRVVVDVAACRLRVGLGALGPERMRMSGVRLARECTRAPEMAGVDLLFAIREEVERERLPVGMGQTGVDGDRSDPGGRERF